MSEKKEKTLKRASRRPPKKARARTGLISSSMYLVEKFMGKADDDKNNTNNKSQEEVNETEREAMIDAGVLNVHKGTWKGLFDMGKSHHVEANLAEANLGDENFGAKTTLLSASAHCEYGLNNSAGINASLVRAEGHLGPLKVGTGLQCDCNASIGVNGVEACVLGTGFSLGPKVAIKTPFVDLSVKLF